MAFPYQAIQDNFTMASQIQWARSPSPIASEVHSGYAPFLDRPGTPFEQREHCEVKPVHVQIVQPVRLGTFGFEQFHVACELNNVDLVRGIVESVSPSWKEEVLSSLNSNGKTALRAAVETGRENVAKYLLSIDTLVDPTVHGDERQSLIEVARQQGYNSILIDLQDRAVYNLQLQLFNLSFCIREHEKTKKMMEGAHKEEKTQLTAQLKKIQKRMRAYGVPSKTPEENSRSLCSRIDWGYQMHQQDTRLSTRILDLEQELIRKDRDIAKWQRNAQMYRKTNCQLPLHANDSQADSLGVQEIFNQLTDSSVKNFKISQQVQVSLEDMMQNLRLASQEQSVKHCLEHIIDTVAYSV